MGEIRDAETAAIAVQSALTGHRVLSSVHANDAFSVIDRFLYMDVEAATFLESLNGVVSQRLVRRLCPHCGGGSVAPAAHARPVAAPASWAASRWPRCCAWTAA